MGRIFWFQVSLIIRFYHYYHSIARIWKTKVKNKMNMKALVSILLFNSLLNLVYSQACSNVTEKVTIVCSPIENIVWPIIGPAMTCDADTSITSSFTDSSVTSVVLSSKSKVKNLEEIKFLDITNAKVKFIPTDIKSQLMNLKALRVSSCGLLSINKENLKEFGISLEFLCLHGNKIISIDEDLFDYNPNLRVIFLASNPIRYIDPHFFTSLTKLGKLEDVGLDSANCINQKFSASNDRNIATFEWNNQDCTDITAKVDTQNLITSNSKCLLEKIPNLKDS